jgi:hypothetical protein
MLPYTHEPCDSTTTEAVFLDYDREAVFLDYDREAVFLDYDREAVDKLFPRRSP